MDNNNMQDQDVTVLVDQNTGAPMYPNSQMNVNQPSYTSPQPDMSQQAYGQSMNQTGYPNMQSGMSQQAYGQSMNQTGYSNMQPGMGQQVYGQQMNQTGYPNMQPGMGQQPYGQPMNQGYNQGYNQNNYGAANNNMTPGMKINPKILAIVAGVILVIILGVIFIPKLFKEKDNPEKNPFDGLEIGMDRELVIEKFDIDDDGDDYQYAEVEAFDVEGDLQIIFDDDELSRCNWYVEDYQCDSQEAFEKVAEEMEEHYTDLYGKPEKDDDGSRVEYTWIDEKNDIEYRLDVKDYEIVLRMDEVW